MANFFAELKRRHIFRVAATYAVVAWVLLQLANNVAPALRIPDWGISLVLLLLVVGFPVALVFAWIHQLAPEDGALARVTTGKLDWALIAALVIVIALVSYQQLAPSSGERAAPAQQAGVEAARAAAASPAGTISLAVLPFANMSGDASQEFFSDGMTEEITSALVKIPDLRVVARTSAFEFKGQNRNIQSIGQQLNATHLIEGSVRKAGDRVRITVQLIKAADGTQIWSENYDRQLTDVFAIQEEIGRAIATSFNMRLGLAPGERLVAERPKDQETYDLFLRGRAAVRARGQAFRDAVGLLEQVVERDPNFAPGWAWLAQARSLTALFSDRDGEASKVGVLREAQEAAARKAIALAPGYSGGYAALASSFSNRGRWSEAMDLFKQGLALDQDDPELLSSYAGTLTRLGYLKEGLDARERMHLLEPLIVIYNRQRAQAFVATGNTDAGVRELERLSRPDAGSFLSPLFLAQAYSQQGRFDDAIDVFSRVFLDPSNPTTGVYGRPLAEAVVQVLRAAANKSEPPARLPDFYSELNFAYAYTGMPERMLDWQEKSLKEGDYRPLTHIWWPTPSSVRKTERFKAFARSAGLVEYWRARGWPDLCRPVGTNDFACD